ncbi:MAG: SDR family NAD(P)-dependent oxidoreductase [Alphaproteobacteria bacterium]|jgi:NAD(P)-dependent dehydrogenase (short-subunit alcohol dehydrogenase family)|nr:SDR family NAD(P)-dependent oxidoreductase [Alphaproteobacteria bacterium]
MRFQDRVALITAAGAGIGRASAEIMAAEGATVVAVDTDTERLDTLGRDLENAAGKVRPCRADALDSAAVQALVAETAEALGRIDILVNAVGGSTIIANPGAAVDELTAAEWQKIVAFNLDGMFNVTNAVVPHMKAQKHGKIVNLASIAGRGLSVNSSSAYAAAKGGVIAFTRKTSIELGPFGITVNAIAPSRTLTERIRPFWDKMSPEDQAEEIAAVPLRRLPDAMDQARVVAFLASSDADFVTGLTIDVTGGLSG